MDWQNGKGKALPSLYALFRKGGGTPRVTWWQVSAVLCSAQRENSRWASSAYGKLAEPACKSQGEIWYFLFFFFPPNFFLSLGHPFYHAYQTKVEGIFPGYFYVCYFGGSLLVVVFQVCSDHLAYNQKFFNHYECKERNTMREGLVIALYLTSL